MPTCKTLLWLDDERDPEDPKWHSYFPILTDNIIWLKSYTSFTEWVSVNGLPDAICFDHDLGDGPSGFDAAKWLTDYCIEHARPIPLWNIQSANPIGKVNIASLLTTFQRTFEGR